MKKIIFNILIVFVLIFSCANAFAQQENSSQQPNQDLININSNIEITKNAISLKSEYLKKDFCNYRVTITSKFPNPLNILSGNIVNAQSTFGIYLSAMETNSGYYGGSNYSVYRNQLKKLKEAKIELIKFNQRVPLTILNPGDSTSFDVLIPIGQTPLIFVNLFDMKTSKLYAISR